MVDTSYYWLRELTEVDLTNATLKDNKFPDRAFCSNIKIQTIFFPDTLVSTGYKTFGFMDALSYIGTKEGKTANVMTFPKTLTTIDNAAFYHDPSLTCKVELPESLTYLGAAAFERTPITGDIVIRGNLTMESDGAFAFRETQIDSIKIEDGIGAICNLAFCCKSSGPVRELKNETLVIPESVKSIGKEAFSYAGSNLKTIIVGYKEITLSEKSFAGLSAKIYFKRVIANSIDGDKNKKIWNGTATILNTDGGTIETDSNSNVIAELDPITDLYTPTKEGYKFLGWYNGNTKLESTAQTGKTYTAKWAKLYTVTFADADTDSVQVAEGETVKEPEVPKKDGFKFDGWYNGDDKVTFPLTISTDTTLTAKWTAYKTNVGVDVKVSADSADKTVEITVNVEADPTELVGATATLNFTDANGNDDSANVAEVKVNGAELNKDSNGKYTANIADLMGTNASSVATYAATVNGSATLTVTYKTAGTHNIGIVLYANNGDVICKKDAKVEIAPEPGTLNLTACTAKLSDGTEVKNGDKVAVDAEVTVTFDKDFYADSNLVLSGWKVIPDTLTDTNGKPVKDITADSFTFVMPEAENGVTIEALTKTADTEDDSWDAATVVTGVAIGAGAAVLTYHIGTELYAEQVLGKGVAVPKTREDVALKAWELAGKPAVVIDGEPLSEAAQAEKWAVESGLMQNDAEGNFNGAKKMNKLKALRVLDKAQKLG